jgi:superfamily I DNA/RNA helicase
MTVVMDVKGRQWDKVLLPYVEYGLFCHLQKTMIDGQIFG